MNVNTGHLITGANLKAMMDDRPLREMVDLFNQYTPVPEHLQKAAETKLAGKDEAIVSLTSGGKLSRWAAQERKKKKKQQMAKESRRRNRGKV